MQMYKVFIKQQVVFLAEHIDPNTKITDCQWIRCENLHQIKAELSQFLSDASALQLFLYHDESCDKLFSLFKSLFSFVEAAGGLVKDKRGRLLFIYRQGLWDLPKGKTEPGEQAPEAALREVTEETGLQNLTILRTLPSTYHIFERKGIRYLKRTSWFEMQSANDGPLVPQLNEDITDARWFGPLELASPLSNTYPSISGLVEDYITSALLFH